MRDSATLGIQIAAEATATWLHRNRVRDSGLFGIWVGTSHNGVVANHVTATRGTGLHLEGDGNHVRRNHVRGSAELDIDNLGDNHYARNRCTRSSGPPVDCP